ncbi:MAG: hypothetical protein ABEJ30_07045 [Halorientalis sp.]
MNREAVAILAATLLLLSGAAGAVYVVRAPADMDITRDSGVVPLRFQCDAAIDHVVYRNESQLVPLVMTTDGDGDPAWVKMIPERRKHRLDMFMDVPEGWDDTYPYLHSMGLHDCAPGENASAYAIVLYVDTLDPRKLAALPDQYRGVPVLVQFRLGSGTRW